MLFGLFATRRWLLPLNGQIENCVGCEVTKSEMVGAASERRTRRSIRHTEVAPTSEKTIEK